MLSKKEGATASEPKISDSKQQPPIQSIHVNWLLSAIEHFQFRNKLRGIKRDKKEEEQLEHCVWILRQSNPKADYQFDDAAWRLQTHWYKILSKETGYSVSTYPIPPDYYDYPPQQDKDFDKLLDDNKKFITSIASLQKNPTNKEANYLWGLIDIFDKLEYVMRFHAPVEGKTYDIKSTLFKEKNKEISKLCDRYPFPSLDRNKSPFLLQGIEDKSPYNPILAQISLKKTPEKEGKEEVKTGAALQDPQLKEDYYFEGLKWLHKKLEDIPLPEPFQTRTRNFGFFKTQSIISNQPIRDNLLHMRNFSEELQRFSDPAYNIYSRQEAYELLLSDIDRLAKYYKKEQPTLASQLSSIVGEAFKREFLKIDLIEQTEPARKSSPA